MKGSFYTLEATIAAIMMIMTLTLFFQKTPEALELSKSNYKLKFYDALKTTENVGDLRKNALDNNANAIKSELDLYIPSSLDYNVTIYNRTTNTTNIPELSSENVITVDYFLSGRVGNYTARDIRIFIWGFD
jgi:hypothetical protein